MVRRRRVTLQAGHSLIQIFTARALLAQSRREEPNTVQESIGKLGWNWIILQKWLGVFLL